MDLENTDVPNYIFLAEESWGNCSFSIIGKVDNQDTLYVYLDRRGYYNVFQTMLDFVDYVTDCGVPKKHSFADKYIEPGEPNYVEGEDILDRYLAALNAGTEWNAFPVTTEETIQ